MRERHSAASSDGGWIEQGQRVVQLPFFGPGAPATARDVEHGVEQLPANLLDGRAARCDAAGVNVHQIMPAPC